MTSPTSQQWRNTVGGLLTGAGFLLPFFFCRNKKDTTTLHGVCDFIFSKTKLF